jgi:S1-C subfamily serine protease
VPAKPPSVSCVRANLTDLLLLLTLVLAVVGGVRAGLVARVATWTGLVGGLMAATRTVPAVLAILPPLAGGMRVFAAVLTFGTTVSFVTMLTQVAAVPVRRALASGPMGAMDRAMGAVGSAVAIGAACWILLPTIADVPGAVSRQVRGSIVLGTLDALTPTPPDAVRGLRALLRDDRLPDVFVGLVPAPDVGPPPELLDVAPDVVAQATASTVNVEVIGCDRRYEGSGVTLGPSTVVTNAHVVAGAETVEVRLPDGSMRTAIVVVYDGDRDLAVLEVIDHPLVPLTIADASIGTGAVVIGHPGGQDIARAAPVRIERRAVAIGRDVTGATTAERVVLFLAARLRPGDSGAPVVDTAGRVVGIVFAISPDVETTAYALDADEVRAVLAAPRLPGVVGPCL